MIQAKVKDEYRFGRSLQAFSRLEFVKSEWRDVPEDLTEQAKAHEWLETRERPVVDPGAIETVAPANKVIVTDESSMSNDPLDLVNESEETAESEVTTIDDVTVEKPRRRGRGSK